MLPSKSVEEDLLRAVWLWGAWKVYLVCCCVVMRSPVWHSAVMGTGFGVMASRLACIPCQVYRLSSLGHQSEHECMNHNLGGGLVEFGQNSEMSNMAGKSCCTYLN